MDSGVPKNVCSLVVLCAVAAFAGVASAGEAIELDFDEKLAEVADELDDDFAPEADFNEDGINNGDGLAMLAAILANPELEAHPSVCEAFAHNRDLIADDFSMFAILYPVDQIAAILGGWMLWDDAAFDESLEALYDFSAHNWSERKEDLIRLPDIMAGDGDANGDGTTNLDHYEAVDGDRESFLNAAVRGEPAPAAEALEIDFDAKLEVLADTVDDSLAPGEDLNRDGITNGDGLALLAAILAEPELAVHEGVHEAFVTNRDRFVADFEALAAMYPVEDIGTVLAGWLLWDDSSLDSAVRQVYDYGPVSWDERQRDFIRLPGILAADGDVSGDGVTNLEHYEAADGDRDEFVQATLAEALRLGQPIEVDFETKLNTVAEALGNDFAPSTDLNEDGIPNGAGLALVAAILDAPDSPAHRAVSEAYLNNRQLIVRDFDTFAFLYPVQEIAAILGAWLMWNDPEFDELPRQLYGFVPADWDDREPGFLRAPVAVAADGDANNDGVTNLEHYEAADGDLGAFLDAALGENR